VAGPSLNHLLGAGAEAPVEDRQRADNMAGQGSRLAFWTEQGPSKVGGTAGGFAGHGSVWKAGLRGVAGRPGRCGVSPLEWVAAHDSSGEGKAFPKECIRSPQHF